MKSNKMRMIRRLTVVGTWVAALVPGLVAAQQAVDEATPWPRTRSTNGNTAVIYQPQVETWTTNSFAARAVVELRLAGEKSAWLGAMWFSASGTVDREKRIVNLDRFEISRVQFPDARDGGSNAMAVLQEIVPPGARTVSLDYLIAALGFKQAAVREGIHGLRNDPPEIIWATNRTVLILVDGDPVLQPVEGTSLKRVVNTPALLLKSGEKFFLSGSDGLFMADTIQGPWLLSQMPPAEVLAIMAKQSATPPASGNPLPRIVVRTKPAELLQTAGLPDFKPVKGTTLQYCANTDNQVFFLASTREVFVLISGRWFKAESLRGPWDYVLPALLPEEFGKIPTDSPQAVVLASVPGTSQAERALISLSTPTTATVSRSGMNLDVEYAGAPKFKPIAGTEMSYAVNAQLPVICCKSNYYAVGNGVWFASPSATGPWSVAMAVPEEIYTIPPDSPVYYVTFVRIYDAGSEQVEVGYTAGYLGAYEDDGTVVYGTGCEYEPYYGDDGYYYGWGSSWGYGYTYVPWYGCWVWRDWWDHPGALRCALVGNVYERWRDGNHVVPHDSVATTLAARRIADNWVNYPAIYGRYKSVAGAQPMLPPSGTLALNPYSRPQGVIRRNEAPRGAELLTQVRQTAGRGQDLYAAQDGAVYQRKNDGWYRRQQNGGWDYIAPLQGTITRSQFAGGGVAMVQHPSTVLNSQAQALRERVPQGGAYARMPDVQALEREHAARVLTQQRQQNVQQPVRSTINRPSAPVNRPSRPVGGGRRR